MHDLTLARIIHIVAVVVWIGGVYMVTTVIIPAIKRMKIKENKIDTFEKIEGRFSNHAKVATLLTAITGFYMIYKLNAWDRFESIRFWWMHAMVIIWLIFTLILFFLEPFLLHKIFKKFAQENPEKTFNIMHRAHWVLLILSIITIIGAIAGSHGWYFF
ncbi:hypothetical protein [Aureivirga marina]|uniref:hypothetical protein n=1 Tax=Aureivirga marina TaxID=1182451 RepID=UPI0018CAB1C4|nr:hypothetical protein [Aureivirga marina]